MMLTIKLSLYLVLLVYLDSEIVTQWKTSLKK